MVISPSADLPRVPDTIPAIAGPPEKRGDARLTSGYDACDQECAGLEAPLTVVREVPIAERRARLGVRHQLAQRAAGVGSVAGSLVALHATDPATVYLSAAARLQAPGGPAIHDAL